MGRSSRPVQGWRSDPQKGPTAGREEEAAWSVAHGPEGRRSVVGTASAGFTAGHPRRVMVKPPPWAAGDSTPRKPAPEVRPDEVASAPAVSLAWQIHRANSGAQAVC